MSDPRSSFVPPIEEDLLAEVTALRRDLHAHPELAWEEHRTASRVAAFLADRGIPHQCGVAGTGVLAELPGRDASRGCIALRADLDALPLQEETGLPFASRTDGVMHACGHDGHTSLLLGAAALLASEPELPVPVRFLFQPAEECGEGASALIEEGALENVALVFGGHIDRGYPLGSIIVTDGPVNASSDSFTITISGRGGHAGRPHEAVDAVVVGSLLVMALQTIVSREMNPAHPSVVTVGAFEAGGAHNVIAERATLRGTIRAQDPHVRLDLEKSIHRVAGAVGALHDAHIEVDIRRGTPAVLNAPHATGLARAAAREVAGPEQVHPLEHANMGAEDFGYYAEKCPACYVRFGTTTPGREFFPAHSSRFDFDERTLGVAAAYFHRLALLAGHDLLTDQPAPSP